MNRDPTLRYHFRGEDTEAEVGSRKPSLGGFFGYKQVDTGANEPRRVSM